MSSEQLAIRIREALGKHNDEERPILEIVGNVVAALSKQEAQEPVAGNYPSEELELEWYAEWQKMDRSPQFSLQEYSRYAIRKACDWSASLSAHPQPASQSVEELADKIARKIFQCGDERDSPATRIQYMSGKWPDEKSQGGMIEAPIARLVRGTINDFMAGNALVPAIGKVSDKSLNEAILSAVAAIYFDDSSDYGTALWEVVKHLAPELIDVLETEPIAAYCKATAMLEASKEAK